METEKKVVRFEALPKPELENLKEVIPDTSEFENPEKARALIQNLNLSVGDSLRENDEEYTINPKMVLEGNSPEYYIKTIENLKKILTKGEIKAISEAISKNTKDYDRKLYKRIEKRTDKFYYRQEIKKSVPDEVKQILEFFKNNNHTGLNNTIYHLLSKDKTDYILCFKLAWKNKPIPNMQEWNEKNEGEYIVLTDSEADSKADDYLDNDSWIEAVKGNNTTSSYEDWKGEVINQDGRGSILSGYNGTEESETIEGTDYYIYRTN